MKQTHLYRRFTYLYSRVEIRLRILIITQFYCRFSKTVKSQLKDVKQIPIIIVNFNQLASLRELINFLMSNEFKNIIIIDNNSTYPLLIDYYNQIMGEVKIIYKSTNQGHMVFWKDELLFKTYSKGYYVVTDPDVIPISECPNDFLNLFLSLLKEYNTRYKVGFSLKIDDIPETNPLKEKIVNWEKRFWNLKTSQKHFFSNIDTTFALYRPKIKTKKFFYNAIRTKYPYQARHLGWYTDPKNRTKEEEFYALTANSSSSWLLDSKGELKHNNYY